VALTAQQQALLGCGSLFGTNCTTNGIGPLTLSAGALVQSFPSFLSTHLTNDTSVAQPGTVGFAGAAGCATLPGCRGVADAGYNASVDGNPGNVGFVSPVGFTAAGLGYQQPGHPFTGQTWQNVLAGFSWRAAAALGLLSGAMLLIGVAVVPFWLSLQPSEFARWFREYSPLLGRLMLPLGVCATVLAIVAAFITGAAREVTSTNDPHPFVPATIRSDSFDGTSLVLLQPGPCGAEKRGTCDETTDPSE